ncbi:uncharacterized protein LOC116417399 [Nasonia vitripennis]|uniref:MADF domain-containing protein n=1 Tax=Nasonia vitripennis TaxID=7425 RepID=A0A7M7QFS7_NASVI|nr:uncharacterized protein LOC116417399 [Nasonia vitripennis]
MHPHGKMSKNVARMRAQERSARQVLPPPREPCCDATLEEVSEKLNGKLNAHEMQLKFKSLKDTFRKIILHEQQASGSARQDEESKWKYYQLLSFLRDSCLLQNNTRSNVPETSMDESMDASTVVESEEHPSGYGSDNDTTSASNVQHRRRRSSKSTSSNQEENRSALNKIADFICQPEPPLQLPTPPVQPDELELLMNSALLQLRKLPYEKRMRT